MYSNRYVSAYKIEYIKELGWVIRTLIFIGILLKKYAFKNRKSCADNSFWSVPMTVQKIGLSAPLSPPLKQTCMSRFRLLFFTKGVEYGSLNALVVSSKNDGELLVVLILLLLRLLLVRCNGWVDVRGVLSIGSTNSNFSCKWSLQNTCLYILLLIIL